MKADIPQVTEMVDKLINTLDRDDLVMSQVAIDRLDDYRDRIREARNIGRITGKEFSMFMNKLAACRYRVKSRMPPVSGRLI